MPGPGCSSPAVSTGLAIVRALVLLVAPHGGQHTARCNAWAGMATHAQRSRARREAAAAVERALDVVAHQPATAGVAREG